MKATNRFWRYLAAPLVFASTLGISPATSTAAEQK
jgi:hypothetical protein